MTTTTHEEQLYKIFNNVNDWLKFAEAKNFGLLTLNAAIVFGFTQIDFPKGSVIPIAGFCVLFPFALLSFITSLLSLFPILSKIEKGSSAKSYINMFSNVIDDEEVFENIHFYGFLKNLDEAKFEAMYLNKISSIFSFSQFEKELVSQILYNSRITWLKYQLFKIGAFFFFAGFIIFLFSLPILSLLI